MVFIVISVNGAPITGTLVGVKGVLGMVGAGAKLTSSIKDIDGNTIGGIAIKIDNLIMVTIAIMVRPGRSAYYVNFRYCSG